MRQTRPCQVHAILCTYRHCPLESGKIAAADPVKADEAHEFWRGTGAVVYGIDDVLYGAASKGSLLPFHPLPERVAVLKDWKPRGQ